MPQSLYAPSDLDVKSHLPEHLRRYVPEALYMLHVIECRRVFYSETRTEYVPLKAEYLRNVMTRQNCKSLVDAMEAAKLIECDHKCIKGQKSFGYRLGPLLNTSTFRPIPTPKRINKRIDKIDMKKSTLPIHLHLDHHVHQVTIDYEDAKNSLTLDELADKLLPLDMIQDRAFWFTPDPYGRVHSNITSLPSKLRQFVRLGEKRSRVHFIDVVNSQPFFLSVVLVNHYNNASSLKSFYSVAANGNFKPQQQGEREGGEEHAHYDGQFIIPKLIKRLDYPKDVNDYIRLTESGQLYERLQQLWNCDRDRAKKLFFAFVLYCRKFDNDYRESFKANWPNVLGVIDQLKSKDYRHCGQMLQRAESAVVIHGACETLRQTAPQSPLLTIHDSIGTTEEHLPQVLDVFKAAFKGLGLSPRLKIGEELRNGPGSLYKARPGYMQGIDASGAEMAV